MIVVHSSRADELATDGHSVTLDVDRLATIRGFRSISGIEWLDRLAIEYPEQLRQFLRNVEAGGWIVKESKLLDPSSPAYFFPRKGRFYYNPTRMTYLDMLHEGSHLESFAKRGNWKLGKSFTLAAQDEVAAYSFELQLLREIGGARPDYLEYLERQIEYYRRLPETLRDIRGGGL